MVAQGDHTATESALTPTAPPVVTYAGPVAYADADAGAGERALSGGLGPSELLHSLRRQWMLGVLIGVGLAVVAGGAAWLVQKPAHTSTAFLRISSRDAPLIFETADRSGRPDFKTYLSTQQQLILTPLVLNAALRSEHLATLPQVKAQTNPIEWLQKELKVLFQAEIGQVSFTDTDAAVAKAVVDGVLAAYMEEVVLAEENVRRQRLDNLERVHAEAETKVRAKRGEMRTLVDTLGSGDSQSLSLVQQSAIQEFGLYRNELTRVQFELMRLEGERDLRTAATGADPAGENQKSADQPAEGQPADAAANDAMTMALDQAIAADPMGAGLIQALGRLQARVAETHRRFTPTAAAERLRKYEPEIADLERQLAMRRDDLRRQLVMTGAPQLSADPGRDLAFEVAMLKEQERELKNQVTQREAEAKKFGRSSIDVEMMRAEIGSLDGVLGRIGEEIERTKIELRSGARTEVISPASAPLAEDLKKRAAISGVGGLAGFGLPVALLVLLDLRRRRVDGVATVTDRLRIDVLGVVPRIPQRELKRLGSESARSVRWQQRLAESISSVTAMVLRMATLEDKRVILVSSAVAGEGKTTLAGQLGVRLAETGHRTLLIDFDLRRPMLHAAFDAELEPGIADLLDGTVEIADAVQATDHPNLSLIAAGSGASNLLNAAAAGTLEEFFRTVRPDYEFIVVDCCPVLPVVDTRLIGQFGDGIILSVLRDVSEAPKVAAARAILDSHGVSLMGTVVTGCSNDVYCERRQPAPAG